MDSDNLVEQIKTIIGVYQPKPEADQILADAKIVLVVSVTSAGKNTIISELVRSGGFYFMVSHTTRAPRRNEGVMEQNGKEYYFVTNEEILKMLESGELLECKFIHGQQFSGVSLAEIQKATDGNKVAISDVEVQGVDEFIKRKPNAKAIFILPPNFEVWQHRLEKRGSAEPAEMRRRFESALMEIEIALSKPYYHFVVNDDLNNAVTDVEQLAEGKSLSVEEESKGRKVAEKLYQDIKTFLQEHN